MDEVSSSFVAPARVVQHAVRSAGRALVGVTDEPVELHPGGYIA